jgi:hypothetical protein
MDEQLEKQPEIVSSNPDVLVSKTPPGEPVPPPAPPAKKIVVANGEEVTLDPNSSALVVMMDLRDGSLGIYDLQNCAHRATAKMLLNEALDHYRSQGTSAAVATMLAKLAATEPKKKGFVMPFQKKD